MRKFAVFDIDGTLIRWQLYHAMTDALAKEGHVDQALYQTTKDARMLWKRRAYAESFKVYEAKLIKTYESVLKSITPDQLEKVTQRVFDEYKDQVYIYTRDLIRSLRAKDYALLAISGSQVEIVSKIVDYYGFDDYVGTVYKVAAGRFTGAKTIGSADKALVLKELVKKHGLSFRGSAAVGDSASDISMLELVETAIAFNPEKKLFEQATEQGWKIVIERKNVIYELEPKNGQYRLAETD
jgi:HAD superfamily hydrolase (TIGR01490 family)